MTIGLISFLLGGLLIGFSIAVPVGPVGVLCIRRTLAGGQAFGFASGLGAATADAIYGAIAGFGLTFISTFLLREQVWLHFIGGGILCILGLKIFLSQQAEELAEGKENNLVGAYASTFFLTLASPVTIFSYAAVFASFGFADAGDRDYLSTAMLAVGVFFGSSLWWLILSSGVDVLRTKVSAEVLQLVNKVSGAIITGFGCLAILSGRV